MYFIWVLRDYVGLLLCVLYYIIIGLDRGDIIRDVFKIFVLLGIFDFVFLENVVGS